MLAARNSQKLRKSENIEPDDGYRIGTAIKIDRCDQVTPIKGLKRDRLVRDKKLYEYGMNNIDESDAKDPFSRGLRLALTSKQRSSRCLDEEDGISK